MAEHNVYRGRVLELRARHFHDDEGAPLTVRTLPTVTRERIVLPDGVLARIERRRRSGSPSTRSGCAPAAVICAAVCCCTGLPARGRR
jgi:hypothetical protein